MEGFFFKNITVELAYTVYGIAHRNAHVSHMYIVIADNCHTRNPVPISREEIPKPFTQSAVHLTDNLIASRKKLLNHIDRPFFKGFRHDGMVGIGNCFMYDGGRLIPSEAFLIDQQAHQFGNSHTGMGIVDMDYHMIRQFAHIIAETFFVIFQNVLEGSAREEIMLFKPQHFSFIMTVFRIEYFADCFCQFYFFGCLYIPSFPETAEIQFFRTPC